MEEILLSLPEMYGDHRVLEVRNLLLALPGMDSVEASSAQKKVRISYDPAHVQRDEIIRHLKEAGYTPLEL